MTHTSLKLTRHHTTLSGSDTDAVASIVAGLIVAYLKKRSDASDAESHGSTLRTTEAAHTQETQK